MSTFRHHCISKQSGDDVLQLYTTLLHAWCSLFSFHELYSKYPDISFEGVCSYPDQYFYSGLTDYEGGHSMLGSLAADASLPLDDLIGVQTNHAPPHASLGAMHGSQSRRRRKAGPR